MIPWSRYLVYGAVSEVGTHAGSAGTAGLLGPAPTCLVTLIAEVLRKIGAVSCHVGGM